MPFAPLAIRVNTKTEIEKKLKRRMIQIIKLINGCELDDANTSANAAAKKVIIDNCLVASRLLELLILVSRVVFNSIQDELPVKLTNK